MCVFVGRTELVRSRFPLQLAEIYLANLVVVGLEPGRSGNLEKMNAVTLSCTRTHTITSLHTWTLEVVGLDQEVSCELVVVG